MNQWNDDELLNAIKLLNEKKTYEEIGILLGRTAKSIRLKLNKNGLKCSDFKNHKEAIICLNCESELIVLKREKRKFCSHSCAASFNNKNTKVKHGNYIDYKQRKLNGEIIKQRKNLEKKPRFCQTCNNSIDHKHINHKYCNKQCEAIHNRNKRDEKIKNGLLKNPIILKTYLREKFGHVCQICTITKWMDKPVLLILDHIDGNSENNFPSNLRLICSNCDAQTPTYKSKNKGNGRHSRRLRFKDGKSY